MGGSITITVRAGDAKADSPAVGMRMQVYWVEPHGEVLLRTAITNADGRTDKPPLSGGQLSAGSYRLALHAGDFFRQTRPNAPGWIDIVPVAFVLHDAAANFRIDVKITPTSYAVTFV